MNQFQTIQRIVLLMIGVSLISTSCLPLPQGLTAADFLGDPNYQTISISGDENRLLSSINPLQKVIK